MKKRIGSIMVFENDETKQKRVPIYWDKKRIMCDGDDITQRAGKISLRRAVDDVYAMYGSSVWELKSNYRR